AAVFHPAVVDFLDLEVRREQDEWALEELAVPARAAFAGSTLRECGIRERTGCTILAIREGRSARFTSNPGPDTTINAGDTLIVLGTPGQLEQLKALARAV
ncbi:MAG TPA: TrkA C-terminal domain-containing protein, partial [Armatimonadota bacterium]|nr:TrkA C-terminal domain-containing protein [Armatimonadota bacterium]